MRRLDRALVWAEHEVDIAARFGLARVASERDDAHPERFGQPRGRLRDNSVRDVAVPDQPQRVPVQHAHFELVPHLVLVVAHAARHLLREVQRGSDRVKYSAYGERSPSFERCRIGYWYCRCREAPRPFVRARGTFDAP